MPTKSSGLHLNTHKTPERRVLILCLVGLCVAIGTIIAAGTGFDGPFLAATSAVPTWRPAVFALLAIIGATAARHSALRLSLQASDCAPALAAAVGVAALVIILDALLFRSTLAPAYIKAFSDPLGIRIAFYAARTLTEEVLYRLVLMSSLIWLAGHALATSAPRLQRYAIYAVIVMVQLINVLPKTPVLYTAHLAPAMAGYVLLRYIIPGLVWGGIYWRFGFTACALAHVGAQVVLQVALGFALLH